MSNPVRATRAGTHRDNQPSADPVIEDVVAELRTRSDVGLAKYKATLDRKDWTRLNRLVHALHEACDLCGYLMAEIRDEERRLTKKRPKR